MRQKSCLLQHSYFYAIENASRLLQHSSGLLGPDDSDSHQVSGVICDTDPPVILSLMTPAADTPQSIMSSDHSGPLSGPPQPLYLEGITQEHWIGISHQSDIVVNLSSQSAPAVTRRDPGLWVISD